MVRAAPVFFKNGPDDGSCQNYNTDAGQYVAETAFTVLMTSSVGISQTRPTAMAITVSTMKGCWLNLDMANTIHTTARNMTKNINKPDIVNLLKYV